MNIRSCELQIHLYAIAPHHCTKDKDESGKNKRAYYRFSLIVPIYFIYRIYS
jgi:hypothetical protein